MDDVGDVCLVEINARWAGTMYVDDFLRIVMGEDYGKRVAVGSVTPGGIRRKVHDDKCCRVVITVGAYEDVFLIDFVDSKGKTVVVVRCTAVIKKIKSSGN